MSRGYLKLLFTLLCATAANVAVCQTREYISPVDFTIKLAGNVGEIRPGHFHSGIDIKATRGVGSPIYAISGGYISRIGVSPTGYGNVLYLTHDNGEVSVYAHLDGFVDPIAKWVKEQQYSLRSFKVNLYPNATKFRIEQGEVIGYMGNSGSSGGPHLHFEIRSKQGNPRGILTDGDYDIKDTIEPTIFSISLYEVEVVCGVETFHLVDRITADNTKRGTYEFLDRELTASRPYYLVYEVIDRKDGANNTMGIHHLSQQVNGDENFSFRIPHTSFATTKYIQTFTQYDQNRGSRYHVLRAYVSEHNGLKLYSGVKNRGIIAAPRLSEVDSIAVTVTDDNRNSLSMKFVVKGTAKRDIKTPKGEAVNFRDDFHYSIEGLSVAIPQRALYDNAILPFSHSGDIYTIGDGSIPLHKPIEVEISGATDDKRLAHRAVLSKVEGSGIALLSYSDGKYSAKLSQMGKYRIIYDTQSPEITLGSIDPRDGIVRFRVTDDISGVKSYTVRIDGKWALGEWDPKNRELIYRTTPSKESREREVTVTVDDYCKNSITNSFTLEW